MHDILFDLFLVITMALIVVDWLQTRQVVLRPRKFHPPTSIFGKLDTLRKVNWYFWIILPTMVIALEVLYLVLPGWGWSTISFTGLVTYMGLEAHSVWHKHKMGIRFYNDRV